MLRRLYDWTMGLAAHRHALALLALVAFVESSIFPIPPDVLIAPMVLAARPHQCRQRGALPRATVSKNWCPQGDSNSHVLADNRV